MGIRFWRKETTKNSDRKRGEIAIATAGKKKQHHRKLFAPEKIEQTKKVPLRSHWLASFCLPILGQSGAAIYFCQLSGSIMKIVHDWFWAMNEYIRTDPNVHNSLQCHLFLLLFMRACYFCPNGCKYECSHRIVHYSRRFAHKIIAPVARIHFRFRCSFLGVCVCMSEPANECLFIPWLFAFEI